jgi:hypothetical protein
LQNLIVYYLGFKNEKDMLNKIINDEEVACWAFQELMQWGLKENYTEQYQVGNINDLWGTQVYKLFDKYFMIEDSKLQEVEVITKTIQVFQPKNK